MVVTLAIGNPIPVFELAQRRGKYLTEDATYFLLTCIFCDDRALPMNTPRATKLTMEVTLKAKI